MYFCEYRVSCSSIMWFLFFLCAFKYVGADLSDETVAFRKCCPKNYSLVKIVVDIAGITEQYECLDRESVEKNYNISAAPLIVGDIARVEYGKPQLCEEQAVQMVNAEIEVRMSSQNDHCFDRLVLEIINGTLKPYIPKIVALTCINKTDDVPRAKPVVENIRKCCPKGQSYDTEYHLCRTTHIENSEEWLVRQLNLSSNRVYEVENGLTCKFEEYGVELREELYSLVVEGSTLHVLETKGIGRVLPRGEWCVDQHFESAALVARVCTVDCSIYGAFCIRKCCPVGQHFLTQRCGSPRSKCVPNNDEPLFNISAYLEPLKADYKDLVDTIGIRSDIFCPDGKVMLNSSFDKDRHQLTPEGYLDSPISRGNDYCLEAFDSRYCPDSVVTVTAVTCFVKPQQIKDFQISFVLMSISCVCLALTLLVYCSLPELRNLHGRTLICHVTTMLFAFACLARVQYDKIEDKACIFLGYGIYFGFVAAFAWLNVMCLDIWWTFGSVRTVQPLRKAGSECRRFVWYSLYAWGVAVLLTTITFLLDRYPVADFLDSEIGKDRCWFGSLQNSASDWPHYIFFVFPMGVVSCTNFALWVLTARHCARVKAEVHRLQAGSVGDRVKRRFRVDRAKYILTGKLWVVMGAGWVSEMLSTIVTEPGWLWAIIDLLNELQGVFIFLILVFKPKVYFLIRKRLGLEKADKQQAGASSARTSSTFLSRTISSDERTHLRTSLPNNVKLP